MAEGTDQELVDRCRQGDRVAMRELVEAYQRQVFNAALRLLGSPDDAADVVQNTFLKVFENLGNYDGRYRLFSWIYRIGVNESLDQLHRRRRLQPLDDEELDETDGPEDEIASAMLVRRVQSGLLALAEDYRVVLVMRHFSDCSYQQIAEVLDLPEKTVKSRIYTARQQLKDWLAANGAGWP